MKTVSIINHKGGVGKTTLTACVSQALALCGFRVLSIDNDSQHNLSTMLGAGVHRPGIADVYRSFASPGEALLRAIRTTAVEGLHMITADISLSVADVRSPQILRASMASCGLSRFYDYVLIDNAPGLDMLQIAGIYAADELFVPTALGQFAVDGIVEMERVLRETFPGSPPITRIIPNFYRNHKRQNSHVAALRRLFPGRVTATAIPADSTFDELIAERKILFLHRLSSKGAAYYLKLMHELFAFSEEYLWSTMTARRAQRRSEEARERAEGNMPSQTDSP